MELSRKGREAIGSGPATLGGATEEEGSTWAQRSFLGSEQLDHTVGAPVLGSDTQEMVCRPMGLAEGCEKPAHLIGSLAFLKKKEKLLSFESCLYVSYIISVQYVCKYFL